MAGPSVKGAPAKVAKKAESLRPWEQSLKAVTLVELLLRPHDVPQVPPLQIGLLHQSRQLLDGHLHLHLVLLLLLLLLRLVRVGLPAFDIESLVE